MRTFLTALAAFFVAVFIVASPPASAQFADQMTFAGTSAGTANAQTITVPNASSLADLKGVIVKFVPGAALNNNGPATLQVNSLTATAINRVTASGLAALVGGELVAAQPVLVMYDGTTFDIVSSVNTTITVGASNLLNSSLAFGVPINLQINATVNSNNLTIALKGNNGSDASATNPIPIVFRDSTIANGDPVIISLQAALSFTINSGNTMGCQSAVMCRVWIFAINNAGTLALCGYNTVSTLPDIVDLNDGTLQTSASGTNGGGSTQTLYCSASAVTGKAIRRLGYVDIQETTAGTWATGPTFVQLFGPGIHKPGTTVQERYATSTSKTTVSATANAKTQANPSVSIIPTAAANLIEARAIGVGGNSGADLVMQLGRNSSSNLFGGHGFGLQNTTATGFVYSNFISEGLDAPNTTSATTYAPFVWSTQNSSGSTFGGTEGTLTNSQETIIVKEIMSALEPANDNEGLCLAA